MNHQLEKVVYIGLLFDVAVKALYSYKVATLWLYMTSKFGRVTTQYFYGGVILSYRFGSLLTNIMNMLLTQYGVKVKTRHLLLAGLVLERFANWLYLLAPTPTTILLANTFYGFTYALKVLIRSDLVQESRGTEERRSGFFILEISIEIGHLLAQTILLLADSRGIHWVVSERFDIILTSYNLQCFLLNIYLLLVIFLVLFVYPDVQSESSEVIDASEALEVSEVSEGVSEPVESSGEKSEPVSLSWRAVCSAFNNYVVLVLLFVYYENIVNADASYLALAPTVEMFFHWNASNISLLYLVSVGVSLVMMAFMRLSGLYMAMKEIQLYLLLKCVQIAVTFNLAVALTYGQNSRFIEVAVIICYSIRYFTVNFSDTVCISLYSQQFSTVQLTKLSQIVLHVISDSIGALCGGVVGGYLYVQPSLPYWILTALQVASVCLCLLRLPYFL